MQVSIATEGTVFALYFDLFPQPAGSSVSCYILFG